MDNLKPVAGDVHWKVLHVRWFYGLTDEARRKEQDQMDDLSKWAFGARGLPQLVFLAFGDFSITENLSEYLDASSHGRVILLRACYPISRHAQAWRSTWIR